MFYTPIDNEHREYLEEREKERSLITRELGESLRRDLNVRMKGLSVSTGSFTCRINTKKIIVIMISKHNVNIINLDNVKLIV